MKKTDLAGSQLTTNHDETTGIKLLNGFSEKANSQIIDAEEYYAQNSEHMKPGIFIDCDTLQERRDFTIRYGYDGKPLEKIMEV